jgi:2-polyprenyl-3-methyl-5-hydroxy-6-metoxy-1,4-benzoquinol methylase
VGARRKLLLETVREGDEVLDVGCWAGATGRLLSRELHATVDGVEPDSEVVDLAAALLRSVVNERVEDALQGQLGPASSASYDSLVFLDVLEHLEDPWMVLRSAHRLLRPGGRIAVSVPNVAHWSVRKELLLGRWRYADNGLLDRTHLRFFTRETARSLLDDAGWRITWEGASVDRLPLLPSYPRLWPVLERAPTVFGVQLLFRAEQKRAIADQASASA